MNIPYGPLLVVEDVSHILQMLDVTLRFKGYPVVTARDGQEALERIAEERPALVITDILMPRMDGYSLVQQLRTNPKTSQIPIFFLSANYADPEDIDFAMRLGASRFLEKPVDTEEFLTHRSGGPDHGFSNPATTHGRVRIYRRIPGTPGEQVAA